MAETNPSTPRLYYYMRASESPDKYLRYSCTCDVLDADAFLQTNFGKYVRAAVTAGNQTLQSNTLHFSLRQHPYLLRLVGEYDTNFNTMPPDACYRAIAQFVPDKMTKEPSVSQPSVLRVHLDIISLW